MRDHLLHCRLAKIKGWIDENNPGDMLIPFSVALEERLATMSFEEQGAELETLGLEKAKAKGATPGLGKMYVLFFFWGCCLSVESDRSLVSLC